MQAYEIQLTVNGEAVRETVEPRKSLVDFLREDLGLTGSHVGCEHGVCGACTVRVDGVVVRGCLMLAVQCDGARVETIEGVSDAGEIADLQEAFHRRNALQCGYCTPGMLLTAQELLANGGVPSRERIRCGRSGRPGAGGKVRLGEFASCRFPRRREPNTRPFDRVRRGAPGGRPWKGQPQGLPLRNAGMANGHRLRGDDASLNAV